MANPFMLSTLGNCGCCNVDCGSVCVSVAQCGGPAAGFDTGLYSGGAITGLTDSSHGTDRHACVDTQRADDEQLHLRTLRATVAAQP